MTISLLLSGGIDSMVVLSLLVRDKRNTVAVFVDYGQAARADESKASLAVAHHFNIPTLNLRIELSKQCSVGEIPHRNAGLIFAAAMATGESANTIAIGLHAGVPYRDCSPEFVNSMRAVLEISYSKPLQLIAPLMTWNKAEIFAYAKRENLPVDLTYSCEAGGVPCGQCASCLDRRCW